MSMILLRLTLSTRFQCAQKTAWMLAAVEAKCIPLIKPTLYVDEQLFQIIFAFANPQFITQFKGMINRLPPYGRPSSDNSVVEMV